MRISVKGRYALVSLIFLAQNTDTSMPLVTISSSLGLSKIYLEQIFSALKRADIVKSIKGAQGGYYLAKSPSKITVCDILSSCESALFEPTDQTVLKTAPEIENIVSSCVYSPLENKIKEHLNEITVEFLVNELGKNTGISDMFYI